MWLTDPCPGSSIARRCILSCENAQDAVQTRGRSVRYAGIAVALHAADGGCRARTIYGKGFSK
jgi:hypothetical protein